MRSSKTIHPYVTKQQGYRGGRAIVTKTSFPVSSVVVYVLQQGMTPEELVALFPHLNLAQVYDALSYYYDHKTEIDQDIIENTEDHWKTQC